MRILVAEDEAPLREQIIVLFQQRGYTVHAAKDGREAQYLGEEFPIDLAVVDLGLPHRSGIEVIRAWRTQRLTFPVLILTARGGWHDKVEGLEAGADDYLVKPFHVEELFARVAALLRRAGGFQSEVLVSGPIRLDRHGKTVQLAGVTLDLTAYEFNTLEYLMQHPGEVISKTRLTDHLYDQDFDRDSNVIEVFIGRLRKKLDPDGTLKPISTLRGQGYRFESIAQDVSETALQ